MNPEKIDEMRKVWDLQVEHGFWEGCKNIFPNALKYDDTEIGERARYLVEIGEAYWEQPCGIAD